ncbi:MAG TPA: isoprenylcysteine carboxylmethyltransferase family protein [Candidatus Limnocylindrales bacterium]
MSRIPSLGPRGEGWVALQVIGLAAVAFSALAGPAWSGPLRIATGIVGGVAIWLGIGLVLRGSRDLGRSLTPFPRPTDGAELVETGIYRRIRNPIYAGFISGAFGWALLTASFVGLAVAVALAVVLDLKTRREEVWLAERFLAYARYRARTRRFIPGAY